MEKAYTIGLSFRELETLGTGIMQKALMRISFAWGMVCQETHPLRSTVMEKNTFESRKAEHEHYDGSRQCSTEKVISR